MTAGSNPSPRTPHRPSGARRTRQWDFIFLDAEWPAYLEYLPDLVRTPKPFGVVAIDNVLSHAHQLTDFATAIETDARLAQTVVPVGAGIRLAVRRPNSDAPFDGS